MSHDQDAPVLDTEIVSTNGRAKLQRKALKDVYFSPPTPSQDGTPNKPIDKQVPENQPDKIDQSTNFSDPSISKNDQECSDDDAVTPVSRHADINTKIGYFKDFRKIISKEMDDFRNLSKREDHVFNEMWRFMEHELGYKRKQSAQEENYLKGTGGQFDETVFKCDTYDNEYFNSLYTKCMIPMFTLTQEYRTRAMRLFKQADDLEFQVLSALSVSETIRGPENDHKREDPMFLLSKAGIMLKTDHSLGSYWSIMPGLLKELRLLATERQAKFEETVREFVQVKQAWVRNTEHELLRLQDMLLDSANYVSCGKVAERLPLLSNNDNEQETECSGFVDGLWGTNGLEMTRKMVDMGCNGSIELHNMLASILDASVDFVHQLGQMEKIGCHSTLQGSSQWKAESSFEMSLSRESSYMLYLINCFKGINEKVSFISSKSKLITMCIQEEQETTREALMTAVDNEAAAQSTFERSCLTYEKNQATVDLMSRDQNLPDVQELNRALTELAMSYDAMTTSKSAVSLCKTQVQLENENWECRMALLLRIAEHHELGRAERLLVCSSEIHAEYAKLLFCLDKSCDDLESSILAMSVDQDMHDFIKSHVGNGVEELDYNTLLEVKSEQGYLIAEERCFKKLQQMKAVVTKLTRLRLLLQSYSKILIKAVNANATSQSECFVGVRGVLNSLCTVFRSYAKGLESKAEKIHEITQVLSRQRKEMKGKWKSIRKEFVSILKKAQHKGGDKIMKKALRRLQTFRTADTEAEVPVVAANDSVDEFVNEDAHGTSSGDACVQQILTLLYKLKELDHCTFQSQRAALAMYLQKERLTISGMRSSLASLEQKIKETDLNSDMLAFLSACKTSNSPPAGISRKFKEGILSTPTFSFEPLGSVLVDKYGSLPEPSPRSYMDDDDIQSMSSLTSVSLSYTDSCLGPPPVGTGDIVIPQVGNFSIPKSTVFVVPGAIHKIIQDLENHFSEVSLGSLQASTSSSQRLADAYYTRMEVDYTERDREPEADTSHGDIKMNALIDGLRRLHTPLIPHTYRSQFINLLSEEDGVSRVSRFKRLYANLPSENASFLKKIVEFMLDLVAVSEALSVSDLASTFGPVLLKCEGELISASSKRGTLRRMTISRATSKALKMVENQAPQATLAFENLLNDSARIFE